MPFGIPSEDFHGGFGLPHDEDDMVILDVDDTDGTEAEEMSEKNELHELLDKISGIFDMAYEFTDDDEEKIYICEVEADLHEFLRKRGML